MESDSKILFCHIPKCSGTNINHNISLKYKENYKYYIHRILQYDLHLFKNYYKFAIIRDPIEKLVSLYFYQLGRIDNMKHENCLSTCEGGNWLKVSNLYKKYNIIDIYSFLNSYKIFYENEIKPEILELKTHNEKINMTSFYIIGYLPQYLFICDNNYNLLVDDVINIKDCDNFMKKKFDITLPKKKLNLHKHSNDNYYNYLTEQNINDIKEIYKDDYTFLINK
jgi:hypothetical protein